MATKEIVGKNVLILTDRHKNKGELEPIMKVDEAGVAHIYQGALADDEYVIVRDTRIWVSHVSIISGRGSDKVRIWTSLPSAIPKVSEQHLTLEFDVEEKKGEEYVRQHFNVPEGKIEIIEIAPMKTNFRKNTENSDG